MASLNKVLLIGNLTRDPVLKYLPSQTAVCEFGLATSRKFKTASGEEREETAFVDCTVFGRGGEIFNQYMAKGRPVFIEGRLKFDSWEDKQGGGKRSKLTVVVDNFQFLGGKDDGQRGGPPKGADDASEYGGGGGGDYESSGGPPQRSGKTYGSNDRSRAPQQRQQPPTQAPYDEGDQSFKEDDIPF